MKNIKLTIEYEGTNYSGWQIQNNVKTVQGEIENAIEKTIGEKIKLIGSSRTDKKVHALGQVANFQTGATMPGERYKYALKEHLPEDITIINSEEVDRDFHSRFDAKKKVYKYIVHNGKLPRALYKRFSYHYPYNLDIEEMRLASKYFIGTQDFRSFKPTESITYTTIKTIYNIEIEKKGDIIIFTIEGKSFLHNMIRIIVGTLLFIGTGRFAKEELPKIIEAKNRVKAGPTAPPQGLYLKKVFYSKKPLDIDKYIY